MMERPVGYAPAARWLHWLVAILLFTTLPLGAVIKFIQDDQKPLFYLLHESLGFLILWFMLARLAVRLLRPPPQPAPQAVWERALAGLVHAALYVVLIAQPIFCFLATNAFGFPLSLFGLFTVWSPIGEDQDLAPSLMAVHVALGYAILALFALHMAGVLRHRLYRRDRLLERMI